MKVYRPTSKKPSEAAAAPVAESVRQTRRPQAKRSVWWNLLRSFLGVVTFLGLLIFLAGLGLWMVYDHFSQDLPPIGALKQEYRPPTVSYFYAEDGKTVIGEFCREHRLVVPMDQIPRRVIMAFVAAEDANFFNHPGFDLSGIIRAFVRNTEAGRIVQGGSTITQQVTRAFLLSKEKSYGRKIREAILSYRLEQNLTKDEILYLYLNQIYLGHGSYGVESAALNYFGKHVGELSLAEAALIAGLASAPAKYSPVHDPEMARSRQRYVLHRMITAGFLTSEEAEKAWAEKLEFKERPNLNLTVCPQFTEHVRRTVEAMLGAKSLYEEGLRVYTTVNLQLQ
ncbi:MAG: transglycosylase domain-containing protein, partial [Pseudomonadota bacterium]